MSLKLKLKREDLSRLEAIASSLREFTVSCWRGYPDDFDGEGNLLPRHAEHIPSYLKDLVELLEKCCQEEKPGSGYRVSRLGQYLGFIPRLRATTDAEMGQLAKEAVTLFGPFIDIAWGEPERK
jgi:hypothetical protein